MAKLVIFDTSQISKCYKKPKSYIKFPYFQRENWSELTAEHIGVYLTKENKIVFTIKETKVLPESQELLPGCAYVLPNVVMSTLSQKGPKKAEFKTVYDKYINVTTTSTTTTTATSPPPPPTTTTTTKTRVPFGGTTEEIIPNMDDSRDETYNPSYIFSTYRNEINPPVALCGYEVPYVIGMLNAAYIQKIKDNPKDLLPVVDIDTCIIRENFFPHDIPNDSIHP